ncbi:Cytochrome c-type biogenesis protein CcmE, heme chaperone [uncultured Gammaproteobacteria bacterium]|nr:Cytochrome c-type biogenesis protein CcmE, heme chaperone [uncultured Gammaproteobacteria bacterium]
MVDLLPPKFGKHDENYMPPEVADALKQAKE